MKIFGKPYLRVHIDEEVDVSIDDILDQIPPAEMIEYIRTNTEGHQVPIDTVYDKKATFKMLDCMDWDYVYEWLKDRQKYRIHHDGKL